MLLGLLLVDRCVIENDGEGFSNLFAQEGQEASERFTGCGLPQLGADELAC